MHQRAEAGMIGGGLAEKKNLYDALVCGMFGMPL